jgi:sugar lactone lactonase YvrE
VIVDSAGNLLIADLSNSRVLKLSPDGNITTLAGNGACSGDYICDSGDGGLATDAQLTYPTAVALDNSGNLFIADPDTGRIRMVSSDGIITTVAGGGFAGLGDGGPATSAQLNEPSGIAVDGAGNLFIADWGNNRVRKVSPDGIITTIAGNGIQDYSGDGGLASSASISGPTALAVDGGGNIYVADSGNNAIRILQPVGQSMMTTVKVHRRER